MKVNILFTLLICILSTNASALSQKLKNSEKQLDILTKHLAVSIPRFILSCAKQNNPCNVQNMAQQEALNKIYMASGDLQSLGNFPKLLWESEANGLFNSTNSAHRLAVTQIKRGATIYINKDLAINKETGFIIDHAKLLSILVHEFGHHAGYTDNDERILDQVSSIIRRRYEALTQTINLEAIGLKNISISANSAFELDVLLRHDSRTERGVNLIELHGETARNFLNPLVPNNPEDPWMAEITGIMSSHCPSQDMIQAVHLSNLHWEKYPRSTNGDQSVNALADLKVYCGHTLQSSIEAKATYRFLGELAMVKGERVIINSGWRIENPIYDDTDVIRFGKIRITNIETNTNTIKGNGTWQGEIEVYSPKNKRILACYPLFTSKTFPKPFGTGVHEIPTHDCIINKVSPTKWILSFKYEIKDYFITSKINLSRVLLTTQENGMGQNTEVVTPPVSPILNIQNENDESIYKINSVRLLDEDDNSYQSFYKSRYDFRNKPVVFEIVFNSCYQHLNFPLMNIKITAIQNNTFPLGQLVYSVTMPNTLYNTQHASIISSECINGKNRVKFGFPFSFHVQRDQVTQYIRMNNITSFRIDELYFAADDHRVFSYRFEEAHLYFK